MNFKNIMSTFIQNALFKPFAVLTLLCLFGQVPLGAAEWQGGDGDWTSVGVDNWGLGIGAYPGDGTYTAELADMDNNGPGVVTIHAGDNIVQGANIFMGANGASIAQTGGTMTAGVKIDNRTVYNLSGGTLNNSTRAVVSGGGIYNISGSGIWQPGAAVTLVEYQGAGEIHVSGGSLTMGRVKMNQGSTGNRVFKVTGTAATNIELDTLNLYGPTISDTATAEFVFDSNGIDPINVTASGGGAKLIIEDLAATGLQGNLGVDLTAYGATSGTEGFVLLDYWLPNRRGGEFGTAAITGINGSLSLGADKDSLLANEYFLSYDDSDIGDGSSIVVYANVIPEPSTFLLLGIALLGLVTLGRRKSR